MRRFNVTVNGTPYQVEIEEVSGAFAPQAVRVPATPAAPVAASPVSAEPVAPAAPAVPPVVASQSALPEGGTKLTSPMPGTIVKLVVGNGASVKKGDVVVILEAMKMENDIVANVDGTINYAVSAGLNVNSGDVIAVIS